MAIAESTHWYDYQGNPCYTIKGANGKDRATTLRDARKFNYVPSVTSIIGVAAKPGLENWKINQALMSALTLPRNDGESLDDFMARAKQDAKEQSIKAAEVGTQIHANIEAGFALGIETDAYLACLNALIGAFGYQNWIAEDSFCHASGYGGKIDLYSDSGIVVDFKTKENIEGLDPAKLVYDEHGMQLSAYAHGLGFDSPQRASVFVDRNNPNIVLIHIWDTESHKKHLTMFNHLLGYWQASKGYKPQLEEAK